MGFIDADAHVDETEETWTYVLPSEDKRTWRVQQMLVDPEEHNDWVAEFEVDLTQSRQTGEPALRLRRIGSLV